MKKQTQINICKHFHKSTHKEWCTKILLELLEKKKTNSYLK